MSVLVVDIGGTFIKYAEMDLKGEILSRGKLPTPKGSRDELIGGIGKLYDGMKDIEGVAVSMPGVIDSEKGYCYSGGALAYNGKCFFADELGKRCPVPVSIENDAKCAVMAESASGSLKGAESGFVLIFGTGIGGGFVKNGRLHKGNHFAAGEVSFIVTERGGVPGGETTWASCCGVPGLCKRFEERKGLGKNTVDGVQVFDAVNAGDEDAISVLDQYTREIGVQISNLQMTLDPEMFAIGGGISAQPVFIDYIRKNLEWLWAQSPMPVPVPKVVCCKFQNDANLYGALQTFLQAKEDGRL